MKIFNDNKKEYWYLQKGMIAKKSIFYFLVILLCLSYIGCNKTNDNNNKKKLENITTVPVTPTIVASQDASIEKIISSNEVEVIDAVPDIEDVDYNDCFDKIKGCAVFFNRDTKVYYMYNKELCEKRSSPNSTFKIISTLIGLENGVINSVDSTMGYDGTIYSNEKWNGDLNLKDAFKESCVWYYRKVIDLIGQGEVQKWLDKLDYGNCDISQWDGNGTNPLPTLNGFWLDSSLEISPKEQVDIIAKIFEGKTDFSEKNINILKEVMLTQKDGNLSVYGKTGTGKSADTGNIANGWFVGMFDNKDGRYYFAVRLTDEKGKDVWGPKAKEKALNIINKFYAEQ
jgi:bla regulator protein BlaR1